MTEDLHRERKPILLNVKVRHRSNPLQYQEHGINQENTVIYRGYESTKYLGSLSEHRRFDTRTAAKLTLRKHNSSVRTMDEPLYLAQVRTRISATAILNSLSPPMGELTHLKTCSGRKRYLCAVLHPPRRKMQAISLF